MEIAKVILEYLKAVIWPATIILLALYYKKELEKIFKRIKKADLPGGVSIETFPEAIQEAKTLSMEVKREEEEKKSKKKDLLSTPTIPLTEANTRMLNLGLSPSPSGLELSYYRNLIDEDPNIALAGLRIEIENMLKNLAKGFNISINKYDGAGRVTKKLKDNVAITSHQAELINQVIRICNSAVHGLKVTSSQAEEIISIAETLRDQYISWLSWGFPKNK